MARGRRAGNSRSISWDVVQELALAYPGTEVGTSYGTPAVKVRGKLFVRLHRDGDSVVVRIEMSERAMRMQGDPKAFHITDHYLAYPWMLVRLSAVRRDDLDDLLEDSWRLQAPQRLVAAYDAAR